MRIKKQLISNTLIDLPIEPEDIIFDTDTEPEELIGYCLDVLILEEAIKILEKYLEIYKKIKTEREAFYNG